MHAMMKGLMRDMKVMKVAIADDDSIVCSSLSTILTLTHQAEVLWTAHDGEETVKSYRSMPPDVLLVDIQMPGMNGLDAAQEVLKIDPQARVLFLTTFADREYLARALQLGAKGYLIKQDVNSVGPALEAVMAGQIVLGSQALAHLPLVGSSPDIAVSLSDRERDVAELVSQGLDNQQIAARLFLSEGTVRNRISELLAKLHCSNRTQLAVLWLRGEYGEYGGRGGRGGEPSRDGR